DAHPAGGERRRHGADEPEALVLQEIGGGGGKEEERMPPVPVRDDRHVLPQDRAPPTLDPPRFLDGSHARSPSRSDVQELERRLRTAGILPRRRTAPRPAGGMPSGASLASVGDHEAVVDPCLFASHREVNSMRGPDPFAHIAERLWGAVHAKPDPGVTRRRFLGLSLATAAAAGAASSAHAAPRTPAPAEVPYRTLGRTGEQGWMVGLGGAHSGEQDGG